MNKKKAEEIVYVYWTRGTLEDFAKMHGYKGNIPKANRSKLEEFVINKLCENK